jgi:hypothetical protein
VNRRQFLREFVKKMAFPGQKGSFLFLRLS